MNVILVNQFKAVYKELDPLKKGYIKLKDLVCPHLLINYPLELNSQMYWRREQERRSDNVLRKFHEAN